MVLKNIQNRWTCRNIY